MSAHIEAKNKITDNHPWARLGVMFFVLIFAFGNYVMPLGKTEVHWWADIMWTVASLLATWRCFAVAAKLHDHEAKAWRLFGLGNLAWFLGILYWDYRELVIGVVTPFPEISDIGFLLFAPLFAAGLIFYRSEAPSASFRVMEYSQLGIFVACIVAAHIVIFYGPLTQPDLSIIYGVAALAYPVLYMALLIQAVSGLWINAGGMARRPLALITLGITAHALTNSFYAYSLLDRSYEAGNFIDIGWIIGFALVYYAAEERERLPVTRISAIEVNDPLPRPLRIGGLVPPVQVIGA